ncbi:biopolymer transporter ExbD [Scytonema sp. UIC 10036]|uniref:ExbD/TolR family protein n=1 Tax=Scytonema sp. UIC 10036 TaxID=2304196 RepID=UPI0012DA303F|nr:biopolymer transporter ExbD [Scytonema sp. UIC 10036]MUG96439.1 biopolymer transporter ExbD [Scytonema sp. UIC 10036]
MRLQDEPDIPAQINIVPMIDVIFAILTFFIMSTLFLTRSEGLPVNLPKAATGQAERPAQLTITINKAGQIFLDKKSIVLEQLENEVRQQVQPQQQVMVVINADEGVNHGQVVGVMDKVRQVEGAKLAIATQKP